MHVENLYYTQDHEWVHFQEGIAYTGVCRFKLKGFRDLQQVLFATPASGFKKQGELLAVIRSKEYHIEAYMPVDGTLLQVNERLATQRDTLLTDPEGAGWIARIQPAAENARELLMPAEQYEQQRKNKAGATATTHP